jgi:hypothetical protein
MTRYYVCPVVGTGTRQDPYRPKAADYSVAYTCVLRAAPDGRPAQLWSLCLVDTSDHTALLADPTLYAMDTDLQAAPTETTLTTLTTMTGVDLTGVPTWRDVVARLGHAHEPTFTPKGSIDGRLSV